MRVDGSQPSFQGYIAMPFVHGRPRLSTGNFNKTLPKRCPKPEWLHIRTVSHEANEIHRSLDSGSEARAG